MAAVLFELPFWLVYLLVVKLTAYGAPCLHKYFTTACSRRYATVYMLGLAVLFLVVVARNDLLFVWHGNEENTRILANLPALDWLIFRGYMLSEPLIALTWLVLGFRRWISREYLICGGLALLPWIVWSCLNSRNNVVIAAVFIAAVLVRNGISLKTLLRLFGVSIVTIYCMVVVLNTRAIWAEKEELDISILTPWLRATHGGVTGLASRLNGIDAMARMKDEIDTQGPALGAAWYRPLVYAISQPFLRLTRMEPLEYDGATKIILLKRYAAIDVPDYSSCMLTDVYGNLDVWGFPLAAAILAFICAIARNFYVESAPAAVMLGIFIFYNIFSFEAEFAGILVGWLRPLLFTAPFWVLCFRRGGRRPGGLNYVAVDARAVL